MTADLLRRILDEVNDNRSTNVNHDLLRECAERIEVLEAERDLYADEVTALKRLAGLPVAYSDVPSALSENAEGGSAPSWAAPASGAKAGTDSAVRPEASVTDSAVSTSDLNFSGSCPVCGVSEGPCVDITVTVTGASTPAYLEKPHPARSENARFSEQEDRHG